MKTSSGLKKLACGCALSLVLSLAAPRPSFAGEQLPLAVAVQRLVPQGQIVVYAPSIDLTRQVDVDPSQTDWENALHQIATQIGVTVEKDGKLLYFNDGKGAIEAEGKNGTTGKKTAKDGQNWLADVASLPADTEPLQIMESTSAPETAQETAQEGVPVSEKHAGTSLPLATQTTVDPLSAPVVPAAEENDAGMLDLLSITPEPEQGTQPVETVQEPVAVLAHTGNEGESLSGETFPEVAPPAEVSTMPEDASGDAMEGGVVPDAAPMEEPIAPAKLSEPEVKQPTPAPVQTTTTTTKTQTSRPAPAHRASQPKVRVYQETEAERSHHTLPSFFSDESNAAPVAPTAPVQSAPTAPVSGQAARLVNGTVMGTPALDAKDIEAMKRRQAAESRIIPQPQTTTMTGKTEVEPSVKPYPVEVNIAPAAQETEPQATVKFGSMSLAGAINAVKPAGYEVIYATNVNQSQTVVVPAQGSWQEKMSAIALGANLRIEEIQGALFINKAVQRTSLDPEYAQTVASKPSDISSSTVAAPVSPAVAPPQSVPPQPTTITSSGQEPTVLTRTATSDNTTTLSAPAPTPATTPAPSSESSSTQYSALSAARQEPAAGVDAPAAEQEQESTNEPSLAIPPTPVDAAAANARPVSSDMSEAVGTASVNDPDDMLAAKQLWRASRGESLHDVLTRWCDMSNVQLVWSSQYDFPLQASITLDDSFEGAIRTMLGAFANASPRPVGRLHRQANMGMRVLIVQTRGNRYGEQ